MINLIIGIVILIAGIYFMFKVLIQSPSLKKRDEFNKEKPTNDAIFPPNSPHGPY